MLDLLKATSILYGDCTQEVGSGDIYISTGKVSVEQMANITAKATELETEYNNKLYQRTRSLEYPSIQDQLDMQYWDSVNGTTTWQDAITAIKTDNPKL